MNDSGRWIYACYFMLAMGILSFSLYLLMPVEEQGKQDADKKEKNFSFFKEPLFYMSNTVLVFYLCAEQGVIGWMITYFKDTGLLNPTLSQITASVLWIMILLGRLTAAWLSTKVKKEKILPVMGAGLIVFFFILIVSRSTGLILFGIMGFGYSMAGIYPDADDHRKDCRAGGYLLWNEFYRGGARSGYDRDPGTGKVHSETGKGK